MADQAASRPEIVAVYAAGLVQGVALVTFPAASSILTSPDYYGLTSTAYGGLFLPQAVAAISGALAGAGLTRRYGVKRIFLAGLVADVASMSLLVVSQLFIGDGPLPYAMLLLATTCLGIGFGLVVPAINTLASAFFAAAADRAVLYLNALLGLGTALAPVLVAIFVGLGVWWGLPAVVAVLLVALIAASQGLPLRAGSVPGTAAGDASGRPRPSLSNRFWLFAAFALLYGVVETMNGNWATLFMTRDVGASTTTASIALTAFWGMVTVGRVAFAAIERRFPETNTYRLLPFVAAVALVVIAGLPSGSDAAGIAAFGLAGLGCSALLPLTISFGQRGLVAMGASVAAVLIAFYQVGYGLSAFGVGPLIDSAGFGLPAIYRATAIVAVVLGVLSFAVVRSGRPVATVQSIDRSGREAAGEEGTHGA
jgi:fucose permease